MSALAHLTVLDLTLARAGPTAVRQFADWGAHVIRIEPPQTGSNALISDRHGSDFQNLHRNKQAITVDLKQPQGVELFMDLAEQADVVIENMRSDVKFRLGIDYESVRERNPAIVYGSISGFGQTGPYANRPGVDQIAQGLGGLMSITGSPGQGPLRVGVPISDLASGMYLAIGCLAALLEREQSGVGQWVTTSLLESQIAMLDFQASRWTVDADVAQQAGNDHPTLIPMGTFATADGHMNISAPGNTRFATLCKLLGMSDLADEPDYATNAGRSKNRDQLHGAIEERTRLETTAHWVDKLNAAGLPCGPIYSIDQTFADPQVQHLAMTATVEHHTLGALDLVRNAVSMSRTPSQVQTAAPDQGEHTEQVLLDAGFTSHQIDTLRGLGVV